MRTRIVERSCLFTLAIALPFLLMDNAAAVVTFDWATVGDPGNAADTLVMDKGPCTNTSSISCTGDGTSGYGSVDYAYNIAKTHVTMSQYTEFLNAVDPGGTNTLELYNDRMGAWIHPVSFLPVQAWTGGIDFDAGATPGSKYSAKTGQENYPATWISWVSGARFVNWLSNGQGSGDTESGVYNDLPTGTTSPIPARAEGAAFFLPNDDEFYKAAYYNPTLNGGAGGYTEYGVGNAAPLVEGPTGGASSANLAQTDGVNGHSGDTYWQTGLSSFDDDLDYLTEVGAYANATSYYGLFDVDGTAYQWLESTRPNQFGSGDLPIFRGGSWFHATDASGAAYRNTQFFATGSSSLSTNYHGIRIASAITGPILTGDYNENGVVDAADYTVWRDSFGQNVASNGDGADGNNNGVIDQGDYDVWKTNFGMTAATGIAISVPEPSGLALLLVLIFASGLSRCRGCASCILS